MTFDAIADCRRMNGSLQVGSILIAMATEAERLRGCGGERDPGDISVDAYLVTACAAHRNGRVDMLAFGFVLVTLGTFRSIRILVQRYGMDAGEYNLRADENDPPHEEPHCSAHHLPPDGLRDGVHGKYRSRQTCSSRQTSF